MARKRVKYQNIPDSESKRSSQLHSAQALLPLELWVLILSFANTDERFHLRSVCQLFKQIFLKQCSDLLFCIRIPPQVVQYNRKVPLFYQTMEDAKVRKSKPSQTIFGPILVWSKEQRLFSRLSLICPHLRALRLHQYLMSCIDLDIKHLVFLTSLKKLELCGFFRLVNSLGVCLPQVQSLIIENERDSPFLVRIFPNLRSLKCSYLSLCLQSEKMSTVSKLKMINDLPSSIVNYEHVAKICPNVQCLSIWINSLDIDLDELVDLGNLEKLFIFCGREGFWPSKFGLFKETEEEEFRSFVPEIIKLLKEIDSTFSLDCIEFRINGFRVCESSISKFHPFFNFLRGYPWQQEMRKYPELDRHLADIARKEDICKVFYATEFESFRDITARNLSISSLIVDRVPIDISFSDLIVTCPHLHTIRFYLTEEMPQAVNFHFLKKLSCLQKVCVIKVPINFKNDGMVEAIQTLPFFQQLCFSSPISSTFVVELFHAFAAKANLNRHIKYHLHVHNYKSTLYMLKRLGDAPNLNLM